MADDAAIFRKSRAVLEAAIIVADGDFRGIDFSAARAFWWSKLTPSERIRAAEIEAELELSGNRRTAEAVELLRSLGAVGVPPPEPIH